MIGCTLVAKFQNNVQFLMSSFPNKIAKATLAMLPFAAVVYVEKRVYFPNDVWAPSA